MKKILTFILCLFMIISVTTGCSNNTKKDVVNDSSYDSTVSKDGATSKDETEDNDEIEIRNLTELTATDVEIGRNYLFGVYEQDGNSSNGKEPIEWRVLDKNGNRVLLISEYLLDCVSFDTGRICDWDTSRIRNWLNGYFFDNAFTPDEKNKIVVARIDSAEVKVFLLSRDEATIYFRNENDRKCKVTQYAYNEFYKRNWNSSYELLMGEAGFRNHFIPNGNGTWWLRTMGADYDRACVVGGEGNITGTIVQDSTAVFVRPVLWFDFDARPSASDESIPEPDISETNSNEPDISESASANTSGGSSSGSSAPTAHTHSYSNATCTAPQTCTVCGATTGNALGHSWKEATCTKPQTCTACGATTGSAAGHTWEAIKSTVHHDEEGHFESVKVKEGGRWYRCPGCGAEFTSLDSYYSHFDSSHSDLPSFLREEYTHGSIPDEYEEIWVVDKEAYDAEEVVGYKCTKCGAQK